MDEQDKKALLAVHLKNLNIDSAPKHPHELQSLRTTNELLKELNLEVATDLANFNFYTFPYLKNDQVVVTFLIFNFWAFILDDYLEHHPKGESTQI